MPAFLSLPFETSLYPGMYAHLMNDYRDFKHSGAAGETGRCPNVQVEEDLVVKVIRDVAAGEELLVDYGTLYWKESGLEGKNIV